MDNASWQLAHDYCAQQITAILARHPGDCASYECHGIDGVIEIAVHNLRDCDCVPLDVQSAGKTWHLHSVLPTHRTTAWYRA